MSEITRSLCDPVTWGAYACRRCGLLVAEDDDIGGVDDSLHLECATRADLVAYDRAHESSEERAARCREAAPWDDYDRNREDRK